MQKRIVIAPALDPVEMAVDCDKELATELVLGAPQADVSRVLNCCGAI